MAELTITVPDALVQRVLDGVCGQCGYQSIIYDQATQADIPNPESKVNFSTRMIREYVKSNVLAWEAKSAAEVARQAAIDSVNTDIQLT